MSTDRSDVLDRLAELGRELDESAPAIDLDEIVGREHRATRPVGALGADSGGRHTWLAAAAAVLVVAGVVGIVAASSEPSNDVRPAIGVDDESTSSTVGQPATTILPAPTSSELVSETTAAGVDVTDVGSTDSVVERVASLDAWSAAQLFRPDAQYRASPEEWADLSIANELLSRECLAGTGAELDPFDPTRLDAFADEQRERWESARARWTPAGLERLRTGGFAEIDRFDAASLDPYPDLPAPWPPECYPAATGVTFGGDPIVWSESRLDDALLGDSDVSGFSARNWGFGRLPGTEHTDADVDACLVRRGWTGVDDPLFFSEILHDDTRSDEALSLAVDFADCLVEVDAVATYLPTAAEYVERFRDEFADELVAIEGERAVALAQAHEVLRAAGLDPLSD